MSIRHLDSMFDPASVVVIGASDRPASLGATVWSNLGEGGFQGPRYAVNLKHSKLDEQRVWRSVAALPAVPELAIICTPAAGVPGLVAELGALGTRAVLVLSSGLDASQQQAMRDAARLHTLRLLGPDSLGLLAPHIGLNASLAPTGAQVGGLAFVSQSGALVTAMLDWASERGVGFSQVVSLGEQADVDFGDMLDYLASDAHTRAILLYLETLVAPRKFMSAARAAARNKPVLVVKTGRSASALLQPLAQGGAPAGADSVFDAAIRRAGMLRVDTLQELFVAAETLSHFRGHPRGDALAAMERLTILTNGGAGVLAADAAALAGQTLATLGEETRQALGAVLPARWSGTNPVDILGDAPVQRYVQALQLLQADAATGTLLIMHAPSAGVPSADIARALVPVAQGTSQRVLSCWLGGTGAREARRSFQQAGIPSYDTPEDAVRAFSFLVDYRRNQAQLMETPPALAASKRPDISQLRGMVDDVLADGRETFTEPEAEALLAACGIPVVGTRVVSATARAAGAAAERLGFPVALKIVSPQIRHKGDVGGVALNLDDAAAVRKAATAMKRRMAELRPDATLQGFSVQPMVRRPLALEVCVAAAIDPLFGPVLEFGRGGGAGEVVADRAVALPPLNDPLARELISRTQVARLLQGWRDVPAADVAALVQVLTAVSQLLADEPRIAELEINPLLVDGAGVLALDAHVRVSAAGPGGESAFAIRPYPTHLVEQVEWKGRQLTLRPIRPEDEPQHLAFLARLDAADIRMRIFYSRRSIEHSELARLTQIDYAREMAFIATAALPEGSEGGTEETLGVARAVCDPDNHDAEFGVMVRSDLKGGGLGAILMSKLIAHLRAHGTQRIVGTVLRENTPMLEFARRFGFEVDEEQAGQETCTVYLKLN